MSNVTLTLDDLTAEILPSEGAVLGQLRAAGHSILAVTPWANEVKPAKKIAADEPTWVSRWRGGWQLCAPTTGQPDSTAANPAFHGAASQAPWSVMQASASEASFEWRDQLLGFSMRRTWSLLSGGRVRASTSLKNLEAEARSFGIAEHLILGGELLRAVVEDGASVSLKYPAEAALHELDYSGAPTGRVLRGEEVGDSFRQLNRSQQARVFALSDLESSRITVSVAGWRVAIDWQGLDHALVWQEFATSQDHPWNSQVLALGIEPTTTPHGVGAAAPGNPTIAGHAEFAWTTTLTIERTGESHD